MINRLIGPQYADIVSLEMSAEEMVSVLASIANKKWSSAGFHLINPTSGNINVDSLIEITSFLGLIVGVSSMVDKYVNKRGKFIQSCFLLARSKMDLYPKACFDIGLQYLTQVGFISGFD